MKNRILPSHFLKSKVTFCRPGDAKDGPIAMTSPATAVMTDLKKRSPITIPAAATLSHANQRMSLNGVHLLFVTDDKNMVVGLITAEDTLGEKPVQYIQKHQTRFKEIIVDDLMTTRKHVEVLNLSDVQNAKVGDIVATLRSVDRIHALVIDDSCPDQDKSEIRGLFSLNHITRLFGYNASNYDDLIRKEYFYQKAKNALLHAI